MAAKPSQEQVAAEFNRLQREVQGVATKINELENDFKEHELVCDCLSKVDAGRKCWRMIGGVLVERSVKEVLPAVDQNKTQIGQVITMLKRQLGDKLKAVETFKAKYGVQSGGGGGGGGDAPGGEKKSGDGDAPKAGGVLV